MVYTNQTGSIKSTAFMPTKFETGDTLQAPDANQVIKMPDTCVSIFNSGSADVTVFLIPQGNDHTKPIKVVINANKSFRDFPFEAIVTTGSTNHLLQTTNYGTKFGNWR